MRKGGREGRREGGREEVREGGVAVRLHEHAYSRPDPLSCVCKSLPAETGRLVDLLGEGLEPSSPLTNPLPGSKVGELEF